MPVDDKRRIFAYSSPIWGFMKRREMREAEERAQLAKRAYQITMRYERFQNGWMVKFTRTGSDWVLRICTFADADKIRSIFRRFAIRQTSEDIAAFECAIQNGGGRWNYGLAKSSMQPSCNRRAAHRSCLKEIT